MTQFSRDELFHLQGALGQYIGSCRKVMENVRNLPTPNPIFLAGLEKQESELLTLIDKVRFAHKLSAM